MKQKYVKLFNIVCRIFNLSAKNKASSCNLIKKAINNKKNLDNDFRMYKIGNVFRNSILNGNFEMALFFPATEPLVNTKALVLLRVSVLFLLSCCVVIWNVLYPDRHSERSKESLRGPAYHFPPHSKK